MRFLLALLLGLLPGLALAQSVLVRTAEHDGFTRVVVDFADRPEWRLREVEGGLRLQTDGAARFDLSDAYRRIGRDRMRAISTPEPGVLRIELGCNCSARTIELANGGLVIDLVDGPERAAPPAQASRAGAPLLAVPGPLQGALDDPARDADVARFRAALLQDLTAGIAAGTLRTMPGAESLSPPDPDPAVGTDAPRTGDAVQPPAHMVVDSAMRRLDDPNAPAVPVAGCEALDMPPISEWAEPSDGAGYVDAVGRVDPVRLNAEIRRLIQAGLGAEARALALSAPSGVRIAPILIEIARLVDGAPAGPRITAAATCNGGFDLMAMLSDPPRLPASTEAALAEFETWPPGLQALLGPRLAGAFLDLGRDEAARLLRAVYGGGTVAEDGLLDLRLDDAGQDAAAEPVLRAVIEGRRPDAGAAMVALIDYRIGLPEGVPADLLDQAEAMLRELSAADSGQLAAAILRGRIARNELGRAARDLTAATRLDPGQKDRLAQAILDRLAGLDDDAAFLRGVRDIGDWRPPEGAARQAVLGRLVDAGMQGMARGWISRSDRLSASERASAARLAEARGDPEAAELIRDAGADLSVTDLLDRPVQIRQTAPAAFPPARPDPSSRARGKSLIEESAALRAELSELLGDDR